MITYGRVHKKWALGTGRHATGQDAYKQLSMHRIWHCALDSDWEGVDSVWWVAMPEDRLDHSTSVCGGDVEAVSGPVSWLLALSKPLFSDARIGNIMFAQ
jgi:hypothetical protein